MCGGDMGRRSTAKRDRHEDALAWLRDLSDVERDMRVRVGDVRERRPDLGAECDALDRLMAEHAAALAALCRMAELGWLAADDEIRGCVTVAWGPDGRVMQLRVE